MADKTALLQALADGGQRAADQYLATQQADQAAQAEAIKAALGHSVGLGITGESQNALRAIIQQPFTNALKLSSGMNAADQKFNTEQQANVGEYQTNNARILPLFQQKAEKELLDKIKAAYEDASSSGGGGGGGGGGSGGGGGGRSSRAVGTKASDWVKQLRTDLGLVGSGVRTKSKDVEALLRKLSLEGVPKGSETDRLPRNLREQAYLEQNYGAPASEVDKAAPITGFLKAAVTQLQSAIEHKISFERYMKDTHAAARKLPGDQSRAVEYIRALALQNLQSSGGGNPLAAAGGVIGGAPGQVGGAINQNVQSVVSRLIGF